jgi:flavin-dependent dehydrogenase
VSLPPSLSAAEACARDWDAIIAGAGPAGALAALRLARAGHSVLLVEAKVFPREKVCGGCLGQYALSVLSLSGLSEAVCRLPAIPITEYRFHWRGRSLDLRRPGGLALSRATLDQFLVQAAVTAGARFLPATTATVVPRLSEEPGTGSPSSRQVELEQSGVVVGRARGGLVVAADGLGRRSLRNLADFPDDVAHDSWIGLQALLPAPVDAFPAGRVVMAGAPGGYAGLVRIEPAPSSGEAGHAAATDESTPRLNLAAAVAPRLLTRGQSPASAVAGILRTAGVDLPWDPTELRWRGTPPLTHRSRRLAHDRVVLVGDSAAYVEPFTGEGMGHALAAAHALVDLVGAEKTLWSPEFPALWQGLHRRLVTRGQWTIRSLRGALHHPLLTGALFEFARHFPALARGIARSVHRPFQPPLQPPHEPMPPHKTVPPPHRHASHSGVVSS